MRALDELTKIRAAFRGWLGLATKGFLWKHLGLPERDIQVRTRGGTTITAPLVRNIGALYTVVDVFALDAYECDWELEDDPVVVDIGANIGAWVLRLAEQRPRLKGLCYEPDPAAVAYLTRNLEANGLADRVEARSEAVSDQTGTALLHQAEPGDGTSSLQSVSHVSHFERDTPVRTVSFSDAIQHVPGYVSLVKIDCEGAEYDIVGSSSADAWQQVKRVVVEYHPAPPDKVDALRGRFADLGYALIKERLRGDGEGTLWLIRSGNQRKQARYPGRSDRSLGGR
jgi:FkbM family methyltransferase